MSKKIKVEEMICFLSQFSRDAYVYVGSFNGINARRGGWDLEQAYVDKAAEPYLDPEENNDTLHFYDEENLQEYIQAREDYIKTYQVDWSESKILNEQKKLQQIRDLLKNPKSPVIFINN